jgi:hypothetical protein
VHRDIGEGVRLTEKKTLIERITIKIKVFDTGKWEWKVRQIYRKNPQIKLEDFVKILDEIKTEVLAAERQEQPNAPIPEKKKSETKKKRNNGKNE